MASLLDRTDDVVRAHDQFIDQQLNRNNITRIHGRARFLSPDTLAIQQVDGSYINVEAARTIIASGSRPRKPDNIPVDHEHIFDSDSILSITYLPRSLTILGGGVIASEYASIFALLGVKVTMIDKCARPLGFLDPELCDRFVKSLEGFGGRYIAGAEIDTVEFDGLSEVVTRLRNGKEIRAEKLLAAQGRVANVNGLDLESTGVGLDESGLISVDKNLRTSCSQISGACVGLLKLVADARTGRVLGVHIVGEGATELVHLGQNKTADIRSA